ncbi:hypothetical protein ACQ4PT_014010 [Festuca glaucescens]
MDTGNVEQPPAPDAPETGIDGEEDRAAGARPQAPPTDRAGDAEGEEGLVLNGLKGAPAVSRAGVRPRAMVEALPAITLDITGTARRQPKLEASSSTLGEALDGRAWFAQAYDFINQAEKNLRVLKEDLTTREADLRTHEAELAQAKQAFQETVHQASKQHQGVEVAIELQRAKLSRYWEETDMELDTSRVALNKAQADFDKKAHGIIEQHASLEDREANTNAATARLPSILVEIAATERRASNDLAVVEERHEKQLAAQAQEFREALAGKDKACRDALAQKDVAMQTLRDEIAKEVETNATLSKALTRYMSAN